MPQDWITPKERLTELRRETLASAEQLMSNMDSIRNFCDKLRVSSELELNEQDKIWLRSIKVGA